jgi:hypothetical protein
MKSQRIVIALVALAAGVARSLPAQSSLSAVWGSGPGDVWAVGDAAAALHWDGRSWTAVPFGFELVGSLDAIWGSGPRDVFAVGGGGVIVHFDGASWTRMTSPVDAELVAVAGRGARDVYALAQSDNDQTPPRLLHYDGTAWTASPLPFPFRVTGLAIAAGEAVVAGFVYFDPQPKERRQAGVVARWSAGRWTTQGWDGRRVADSLTGSTGWTRVAAAAGTLLLLGQNDEGDQEIATRAANGGWSLLPLTPPDMPGSRVRQLALAGDLTPIALYEGSSFARFTGGRWVAVNGRERLMQALEAQQQSGATEAQMQQAVMRIAARMEAYDMSRASAVWGTSAADFWVVTDGGRIVRVQGDDARIVYDAECADPARAGMNPVCQALRAKP